MEKIRHENLQLRKELAQCKERELNLQLAYSLCKEELEIKRLIKKSKIVELPHDHNGLFKFLRCQNLPTDSDSQCVGFLDLKEMGIVSMTKYMGFGVAKINVNRPEVLEFFQIGVHTQKIKQFKVSPFHDSLMLAASRDHCLSLSSLNNNSSILRLI